MIRFLVGFFIILHCSPVLSGASPMMSSRRPLNLTPDYKKSLHMGSRRGFLSNKTYHAKGLNQFQITSNSQKPVVGLKRKKNQDVFLVSLLSSNESDASSEKHNWAALSEKQKAENLVEERFNRFEKQEEKTEKFSTDKILTS